MDRLPLTERIAPVDEPPRMQRTRLEERPARRRIEPARHGGNPERGRSIDPHELYKLARMGCTKAEAAQFFGLTENSLSARVHRDFELRIAWDRGSAQSKISLRRLQMRHAHESGDAGVRMTIHMSKHQLGEVEVQQVQHGGMEDNPIRFKVERDELIGRIVGNRTIEAGSES